jgi:hypothetical protein
MYSRKNVNIFRINSSLDTLIILELWEFRIISIAERHFLRLWVYNLRLFFPITEIFTSFILSIMKSDNRKKEVDHE